MLTQRQETFCQEYIKTRDPDASYVMAGYSPRFAENNVHKLLKNTKVQARLNELNTKPVSSAIATAEERQQILTEIARARIPDYQTSDGITVDKDSPNTSAIESLEVFTKQSRESHAGSITIKRPVVPEALRNLIFKRDNHRCRECGAVEDLQLDHIISLSRGGFTVESNLQTLCETCNKQKAGGKKSQPEVITRLKLHNPIAAIAELNKMDHLYNETPPVNDNRVYNILVSDKETREAVLKLVKGEPRQLEEG